MNQYNNSLIFGKDPTEEITAIEIKNNQVYLFKKNGSVEKRPHIYWILSSKKIETHSTRLNGNQHYKYITYYEDEREYKRSKYILRKKDKDAIYTISNQRESAMVYYGITLFKGLKVEDVSVLSFDIESQGLVRNEESEVYVITNTFKKDGKITKKQFRLDEYESSKEMIDHWCNWVRSVDPCIINGHNIYGYDLDYLNHVAKLRGTKLLLGKDGSEMQISTYPSSYRVDGSQTWDYTRSFIFGRHIIDGMFLAVKYDIGKNYPSWRLKDIAVYEGVAAEDREYYDASQIGKNWHIPEEREKIVAYCEDDGDESLALYELMIPSYFYLCQSIPKPFQTVINSASGAWLNSIMVRAYLQQGMSIPKYSENSPVAGGMSYGVPGNYRNVIKWDAKSYYPSTILAFDIYDEVKDPNKYYLEMVRYFTYKRFEYKDELKRSGDKYYDDMQAAMKIFINSAYGLLATPHLHFNSPENAALITKCCRKGLQKAIEWATGKNVFYWWRVTDEDYKIIKEYTSLEKLYEKYQGKLYKDNEGNIWIPKRKLKDKYKSPWYGHSIAFEQDFKDYSYIDSKCELSYQDMPRHDWKLVNLDTDSLSFCKQDESEFTEQEYANIQKEINQIMYSEWEEDGIFEKALILKAKNYCLLPKGSDKIKLKGSSITDSKKEPALSEFLTLVIDSLIFDKNEELKLYNKYVKEAISITDINRWATKKSITKAVLNPTRSNEQKILDAVKGEDIQEGNKVYLYSAIDGLIPVVKNGKIFKNRKGEVKYQDNCILKLAKNWSKDEDKWHYVKRVYDTITILHTVIDLSEFPNYYLKKNRNLVDNL